MKISENRIRNANKAGLEHGDSETEMRFYEIPVLDVAYDAGRRGFSLGEVVDCVRFGNIPENACSRNFANDTCEPGVSVISAGTDSKGSDGAEMFMSNRKKVSFRGMVVVGARGSDGEPLVVPVNFYDDEE